MLPAVVCKQWDKERTGGLGGGLHGAGVRDHSGTLSQATGWRGGGRDKPWNLTCPAKSQISPAGDKSSQGPCKEKYGVGGMRQEWSQGGSYCWNQDVTRDEPEWHPQQGAKDIRNSAEGKCGHN